MAIVKNYTTAYWGDLLSSRAGDLPIARLNAWLDKESEGFPQALGTQTEVGIFQVDLQDGPKYGGTLATLHDNFCDPGANGTRSAHRNRDLTDDEEALQVDTGVAMVREFMSSAQSLLDASNLQWSDDDFWCFVKLHHGLPALKYILDDAAAAQQASDWGSFRSFTLGLSAADAATYGRMSQSTAAYYMPFDRFFDNAESVGYVSGGGIVGGGGLSQMGKALVAVAIFVGAVYYGGRHGLAL